MNNALIFIPDISGFTQFVTQTPVEHSRHIISELLELIIASNSLDLKVSEVEGDAVLFYREGPPPSTEEILEQVRTMYIAFHTHLKRYESLRICHCDACNAASSLNLKFVVHYGEIGFIEILKATKPHGPALILAHRLLKNSIPEHAYLLLTDAYTAAAGAASTLPAWAPEMQSLSDQFDLGEVTYGYFGLHPLLSEVPPAPRPHLPEQSPNPLVISTHIPGDLETVFERVSNLNLRTSWNPDTKMLDYDPAKINRAGTTHRCLVGNQEVMIETTQTQYDAGLRTFGERITGIPVIGFASIYYLLQSEAEGTSVRVEMHFPKVSFFKKLVLRILRGRLRKNLSQSLLRLRDMYA